MSSKVYTADELEPGDIVQIRDNGIDVTNGIIAHKGVWYGEDGPYRCVIELIDKNWYTGGAFGLNQYVVKVRCRDEATQKTVVWQVQPEDIVVKQKKNPPKVEEPKPDPPKPEPTPSGSAKLTTQTIPSDPINYSETNLPNVASDGFYAIPQSTITGSGDVDYWDHGVKPSSTVRQLGQSARQIKTDVVGDNPLGINDKRTIGGTGSWRKLNEKERRSIGQLDNLLIDDSVVNAKNPPNEFENAEKRRYLLNDNKEDIQNESGFPYQAQPSFGLNTAKYNYQILIDDPKYSFTKNLETQLRDARKALGIQVHGNNRIAKAIKYYMYNRFHTPDPNLAHNKSVTYIFFTRPDCNLIKVYKDGLDAVNQVKNHTEGAMYWRKYPGIFKLLSDGYRIKDNNNFNMLLSNQVTSFDIQDETLGVHEVGKSWGEHSMQYGDSWQGRNAGEFSCDFDETADYDVIHFMKLWITYIDNVSRGAWSPSYDLKSLSSDDSVGFNHVNSSYGARVDLDSSHVYRKELDYASSVYVFKCGPDGEDILYWTKYYGVFPTNTGAAGLSYNRSNNIGDPPKLSIKFRYSFKRDFSPVSLIEFNQLANIGAEGSSDYVWLPGYEYYHAGSEIPYVGTPFIVIDMHTPNTKNSLYSGFNYNTNETHYRLKFKEAPGTFYSPSDNTVFGNNLS